MLAVQRVELLVVCWDRQRATLLVESKAEWLVSLLVVMMVDWRENLWADYLAAKLVG